MLWALARTLGADAGHPLVAAIAFTPYVAALSPLPVVLALTLRAWPVAAVAALACVALVAAVLPRALDGPQLAPLGARGTPVVVMTVNMYEGQADARTVMRLVREYHVDVLSLQELTPAAVVRLDAAGARTLLPGRVLRPVGGAAGFGLLARTPLRATAPDAGEVRAQPEGALAVRGRALRVKVVHPFAPTSAAQARLWQRQLRELPGPDAGGVPRVLAGDFNATLDHRELRRLLDRGFYDAADATGDGLRPTWPVRRRRPPLTLDHVLVPDAIRIRRLSLHDIPGGDHRAVIADLLLAAPRR